MLVIQVSHLAYQIAATFLEIMVPLKQIELVSNAKRSMVRSHFNVEEID